MLFDFLNGLHVAANSIATIVSTRELRRNTRCCGRPLQLHRVPVLRPARGADARHRHRRRRNRRSAGDPQRARRRHRLERGDLDLRHPVEFLARPDRRPRRRRHHQGGPERRDLVRPRQDRGGHRALAAQRFVLALLLVLIVVVGLRAGDAVRGRSHLPRAATRLGLALLAGPRRNDAQKTMGTSRCCSTRRGISGATSTCRSGWCCPASPRWRSDTLLGGWRIGHTMGSRITRLNPMQGFCAETGGAITLFLATWSACGSPRPHTITGAIVGVGAARRASAVRWGVAGNIVIAWVVTLPAAAGFPRSATFSRGSSRLEPPRWPLQRDSDASSSGRARPLPARD